MKILFYEHLIDTTPIETHAQTLGFDEEEQAEFLAHIHELLHQETITIILTHLPQEHHAVFVTSFLDAPHREEHIHFLKKHAREDIEEVLKKHFETVIAQLIDQMRLEESSSGNT